MRWVEAAASAGSQLARTPADQTNGGPQGCTELVCTTANQTAA